MEKTIQLLRVWDMCNYQYFVNYKDSDEYLYNRNPKLYTCYHGNPICGCGWYLQPTSIIPIFRSVSSTQSRRQFSFVRYQPAIHVQLMVFYMVQSTWIGRYQQQSCPTLNIINIEEHYDTKCAHKRASIVNSLPCSKFCYCLFRCNPPSHFQLLGLAFFCSVMTPTLFMYTVGSIECKGQASTATITLCTLYYFRTFM